MLVAPEEPGYALRLDRILKGSDYANPFQVQGVQEQGTLRPLYLDQAQALWHSLRKTLDLTLGRYGWRRDLELQGINLCKMEYLGKR